MYGNYKKSYKCFFSVNNIMNQGKTYLKTQQMDKRIEILLCFKMDVA